MHTFRAPAKPLEPPTPRTSVLGLDRLAHEKRAAAAILNGESSRKKAKLAFDDDEGGTSNLFKGAFSLMILRPFVHDYFVAYGNQCPRYLLLTEQALDSAARRLPHILAV